MNNNSQVSLTHKESAANLDSVRNGAPFSSAKGTANGFRDKSGKVEESSPSNMKIMDNGRVQNNNFVSVNDERGISKN